MPRHRMTLSRHQDNLLQTPATLETLGSTSAVPLHRLEAGRQHVSTQGYTVVEQPVARDLLQSLAAGIMLVEPQQSSDNSFCSHPAASNTSQAGIICHKLQKTDFGSKLEAKFWIPKMMGYPRRMGWSSSLPHTGKWRMASTWRRTCGQNMQSAHRRSSPGHAPFLSREHSPR